VRLGGYDFTSSASPEAQDYQVDHFRIHPKYNRYTNEYDIAIIALNGTTKLTETIKPICLPQSNRDYSGQLAIVTGWGTMENDELSSKVLRQVSLPVWNLTACDAQYSQKITQVFLCAGYREGGKDSCQGDSGGKFAHFSVSTKKC
jgi:serine protease 56